ncbi:MAG: IPT/TIG domain-containing protein [Frankiaceae bacterium]|nr:IPT/TIG domain-containing protein [Frankiaceae bacterium]
MSTRSTGDKVSITPIYWAPSGYSFTASYKSLINRYLADAAADSDKATNVFSTLWEYYGSTGYINYRMQRWAIINDTQPYPAAGCTTNTGPVYSDNSGYSTCLDDDQVSAEIDRVVAARGLPRDNGHMYVMFLPKHVESCFYPGNPVGQACTLNASPSATYCAYHSMMGDNKTVYANMPFPVYSSVIPFTCGSEASFPTNEAPNGDTDADVEISPLSHEIAEAITDPDVSAGWYDSSGYENGDECAYAYGAASGTAGALYNQTINGHHYLTQEEFSNYDFGAGRGGCLQGYYPNAKPTIHSMSSHAGSTAGGATITIIGTTYGGTDSVKFGTVPATFTLIDPTHLKVTVPAHAAGQVDVIVHNAQGDSAVVGVDHYKYS